MKTIFPWILLTILLAVAFGNGHVIITIAKDKKLRNDSRHVVVTGLAFSNVLTCAFTIIGNVSLLLGVSKISFFVFELCIPVMVRIGVHWAHMLYIGSIFVMNLDQYLSIRAPLWHHLHFKSGIKGTKRIVMATWLLLTAIFIIIKAIVMDANTRYCSILSESFQNNIRKDLNEDTNVSTHAYDDLITTATDYFFEWITMTESPVTKTTGSENSETNHLNNATTKISDIDHNQLFMEVDACNDDTVFCLFDLSLYSYMFLTLLAIAIIFQSVCYSSIYIAIRSKTLKYGANENTKRNMSIKKLKISQNAAKRFGILLLTFIIAYLPYYILINIQAKFAWSFKDPSFLRLSFLTILLRILKFSFDPFLYTIHCKELRAAMSKICS